MTVYSNQDDAKKPAEQGGYDLAYKKTNILKHKEIIKKELFENIKRRYQKKPLFSNVILNANSNVIKHLLSFRNVQLYNEIATKSSLNRRQRDLLPQLVWTAFLENKIDDLENRVLSGLRLSINNREVFLSQFRPNIVETLKALSLRESSSIGRASNGLSNSEKKTEKKSLKNALIRFPKLGEQLITSAPLKLRIFPEMVKPSLKNWIADYHDSLGIGKHGMMERGNFLFHGENSKRLTSLERRRLAEVLKSLDDGSELSIDGEAQKIVFENKASDYEVAASGEMSAPGVQSASSTNLPNSESKKQTSNVDMENGLKVEKISGTEEEYQIPGTDRRAQLSQTDPKNQKQNIPTWNPAKSVRNKMNGEDASFGSFQVGAQKKAEEPKMQGNIRFSSPQTLPIEKNNEAPKKLLPKIPSSQAQSKTLPPHSQSRSAFSIAPHSDDDLMAKIRELKKQPAKKLNPRAVYKITPMGFVDKDGDKMQYQSDGDNLKISKNVVDLRKKGNA